MSGIGWDEEALFVPFVIPEKEWQGSSGIQEKAHFTFPPHWANVLDAQINIGRVTRLQGGRNS